MIRNLDLRMPDMPRCGTTALISFRGCRDGVEQVLTTTISTTPRSSASAPSAALATQRRNDLVQPRAIERTHPAREASNHLRLLGHHAHGRDRREEERKAHGNGVGRLPRGAQSGGRPLRRWRPVARHRPRLGGVRPVARRGARPGDRSGKAALQADKGRRSGERRRELRDSRVRRPRRWGPGTRPNRGPRRGTGNGDQPGGTERGPTRDRAPPEPGPPKKRQKNGTETDPRIPCIRRENRYTRGARTRGRGHAHAQKSPPWRPRAAEEPDRSSGVQAVAARVADVDVAEPIEPDRELSDEGRMQAAVVGLADPEIEWVKFRADRIARRVAFRSGLEAASMKNSAWHSPTQKRYQDDRESQESGARRLATPSRPGRRSSPQFRHGENPMSDHDDAERDESDRTENSEANDAEDEKTPPPTAAEGA